jgi:hypothetical protein
MSESITLAIPIRDGTTQTVSAVKATEHFAVHLALDTVVFANNDSDPWAITHIPTLCRVLFSDSQANAKRVARLLEELPVDWNLPKCADDMDRKSRKVLIDECQLLSKLGLGWAEWC